MLRSVPFNMPLNNDIKRLEIRFFSSDLLQYLHDFDTAQVGTAFSAIIQAHIALCCSVVKTYTQYREWLRIP